MKGVLRLAFSFALCLFGIGIGNGNEMNVSTPKIIISPECGYIGVFDLDRPEVYVTPINSGLQIEISFKIMARGFDCANKNLFSINNGRKTSYDLCDLMAQVKQYPGFVGIDYTILNPVYPMYLLIEIKDRFDKVYGCLDIIAEENDETGRRVILPSSHSQV